MRCASTSLALAATFTLCAGCGGTGDEYHETVHAGKVTGKITGKSARSAAGDEIVFTNKSDKRYYGATIKDDLTFELTAPPGDYEVMLGTRQFAATIAKGANTVTVDLDQVKANPMDPGKVKGTPAAP
jgi:hypothetical protein